MGIVTTNRRMLEKNGYKVLSALNGQQALDVFEQNRHAIDLVVTDIMMPGMDGLGFIRAVRLMDPEMKIIASSGLGSGLAGQPGGDARSNELRSLNVNAFIPKPYTAARLLTELNRVLRSKKGSDTTVSA